MSKNFGKKKARTFQAKTKLLQKKNKYSKDEVDSNGQQLIVVLNTKYGGIILSSSF